MIVVNSEGKRLLSVKVEEPISALSPSWQSHHIFALVNALINILIIHVIMLSGIPIRTTLDNSTTVSYAGLMHQLCAKARSCVRDIDPQNDLTFCRIRTRKYEIMLAPGMIKQSWKVILALESKIQEIRWSS